MAVSGAAVAGIVGAILGAVGLTYALTRPAAGAAAPSGGGGGGGKLPPGPPHGGGGGGAQRTAWLPASQINPGDHVRISIAGADLASLAQSIGYTPDEAGWESLLASPLVVRAFGYQSVYAWGPGDPKLPADWPTDDTNAATEYHAEFTYGAPQALLLAASPIPVKAWTAKGLGA